MAAAAGHHLAGTVCAEWAAAGFVATFLADRWAGAIPLPALLIGAVLGLSSVLWFYWRRPAAIKNLNIVIRVLFLATYLAVVVAFFFHPLHHDRCAILVACWP